MVAAAAGVRERRQAEVLVVRVAGGGDGLPDMLRDAPERVARVVECIVRCGEVLDLTPPESEPESRSNARSTRRWAISADAAAREGFCEK